MSERVTKFLLLVVAAACGQASLDMPGVGAQDSNAQATGAASTSGLTSGPVRTFGKVPPVDEAGRDPEFAAFRSSLIQTVSTRDTLALFAMLTPEVKLSFGGDFGRAGLRSIWDFDKPGTQMWRVLDDVLHHGGRFSTEASFFAPYTFLALPDSLDAFSHVIVRDSNALVYATPDSTTAPIARLSYDIVQVGEFSADPAWRTVLLTSGATAYVHERDVRSPVDYRVGFERIAGRWMVSLFLSGD